MLVSHDALKFAKPFECVRVKMNVGIRPVCSPAQCLQLIIIRQRHTNDPLTTHRRTSGWLRDVEAVSEVGFGLVVIDLTGVTLRALPPGSRRPHPAIVSPPMTVGRARVFALPIMSLLASCGNRIISGVTLSHASSLSVGTVETESLQSFATEVDIDYFGGREARFARGIRRIQQSDFSREQKSRSPALHGLRTSQDTSVGAESTADLRFAESRSVAAASRSSSNRVT